MLTFVNSIMWLFQSRRREKTPVDNQSEAVVVRRGSTIHKGNSIRSLFLHEYQIIILDYSFCLKEGIIFYRVSLYLLTLIFDFLQ